jgi:hypothetical protein
MRWEQHAGAMVPLAGDSKAPPITLSKLAERDEELAWLMRNRRRWRLVDGHLLSGKREAIAEDLRELMMIGRTKWKSGLRDLAMAGIPVASEGTYGGLGAYPLPGSLAGVALTASEALLIPAANLPIYLPIPQNGVLAPQAYRVVITGSYTVGATPGSMVTTMRFGNATTSPSLGISAGVALTNLTNAFWYLMGDLTIQSVGPPGTNSKVIAQWGIDINTAVGGAVNRASWGITAAASVDTTITAGTNGGCLTMNVNDQSATNHATLTVAQVHFMDWD